MTVSRSDIEQAAQLIGHRIRRTPIIPLERGAFDVDAHITLKLEYLQYTGSFKARGAFNRILESGATNVPIIAASGGNHGAAVAFAARPLGLHAEIFVPVFASPIKIARLHRYGADVRVAGVVFSETLAAAATRAQETGGLMVHAYDQLDVIAGQGTVAQEMDEQAPDLDTVLVAVGGGGLVSGVTAWYVGRKRVVGVEPMGASAMTAALRAGQPVEVAVHSVAADALGASRAGENTFAIVKQHETKIVLVEDDAIVEAQRVLWADCRIAAEPGGAAALAPLISGRYVPAPGEHIGVIICGANVDLQKVPQS